LLGNASHVFERHGVEAFKPIGWLLNLVQEQRLSSIILCSVGRIFYALKFAPVTSANNML